MPANITKEQTRKSADGLVEFINNSPSPYHTVNSGKTKLIAAGFKELSEKQTWHLKKGEKYFLTRNESALIAFIVGDKYQAGNGISLIGAHTDSPCLKLKPNSKKNKYGYLSVGVQCYGGGLWTTWFDRDLTVAGRVMIKNSAGHLEHHLINVKKPILRVPMLCIHLQREIKVNGFNPNLEIHTLPVLATKVFEDHLNKEASSCSDDTETEAENTDDEASKHHTALVKVICKEIGCKAADLVNMELAVVDCQPAVIGGVYEEFVFAPRLDNQFNSYCAVSGIIESAKEGVTDETNIRMINLFDNEECGSESAQGANSMLAELVMRRVCECFGGCFEQCIANSFLLSADQGHAIHPNYPEKHEENHQTALHKGPMLKINCNQRYATNAITASVIREIAKQAGIPLQDYVVRNDSACGTTIGPIQSAKLGIRTVDVGGPELSMHSIREMCDITSVEQMIVLFKSFFRLFPKVDAAMKTGVYRLY